MMLTEGLVEEAIAFLSGRIRRTPVEFSPALSAMAGVPVWLKLEFLQLTGSFKLRGALFRLSKLSETERRVGFVTSSAGNHGKAVAYAAKQIGLHAVVCVPSMWMTPSIAGWLNWGLTFDVLPSGATTRQKTGQSRRRRAKDCRLSPPTTTKELLLPGADRWRLRFSKTSPMRARS